MQIDLESALVYEEFFVPALFGWWAARVTEAAVVRPGERVLDVACGTGVLARAAAKRVGRRGQVVGLDASEAMLNVAARIAPEIEWRRGVAEDLPFPPNTFDAVVCQFGLMFFNDRVAALREMLRVAMPRGRVTLAVWDTVDRCPGYDALAALLERQFGRDAADALRAPFSLGDLRDLSALLADAGVSSPDVTTLAGTARFPSVRAWMYTDVKGWSPLGQLIDDAQMERLTQTAEQAFQSFLTESGAVEFPIYGHIVSMRRDS